jgi:hypothetical protein
MESWLIAAAQPCWRTLPLATYYLYINCSWHIRVVLPSELQRPGVLLVVLRYKVFPPASPVRPSLNGRHAGTIQVPVTSVSSTHPATHRVLVPGTQRHGDNFSPMAVVLVVDCSSSAINSILPSLSLLTFSLLPRLACIPAFVEDVSRWNHPLRNWLRPWHSSSRPCL